jgi:acetoin utilization protein AcuB
MQDIPSVKSVMTVFPYFVTSGTTVRRAREMMAQHGIRHLPVMRGKELVGVVTDRDMERSEGPKLGLPSKDTLSVSDGFVREAYVVEQNEPLDEVLSVLAEKHLDCALVVNAGRLVGIYTTTDACRAFAEHLQASAT